MRASSQRTRRLRLPLSLRSCTHGSRRWLDSNGALTASFEARGTPHATHRAGGCATPSARGRSSTSAKWCSCDKGGLAGAGRLHRRSGAFTRIIHYDYCGCSSRRQLQRSSNTTSGCNDWRHTSGVEQARRPEGELQRLAPPRWRRASSSTPMPPPDTGGTNFPYRRGLPGHDQSPAAVGRGE